MAELDLKAAAARLACPAWPDCADDEGPCLACAQADAIIAALEDCERLRAALESGLHSLSEGEPFVAEMTFRAALEDSDG